LSLVFTIFVTPASLAFSAFCLSSATITPISTNTSQPDETSGLSQFTMELLRDNELIKRDGYTLDLIERQCC
jgi:hypothetical protein